MIVYGDHDHARSIASSAGFVYNQDADVCISRTDERGTLLGGIVFQGYTKVSIDIHTAGFSPRWLNRDLLWIAFHYPFNQLKCKKIFAHVPISNIKAVEFDRKLGFVVEHVIEDAHESGALLLMSMKREDCRWLKIKPETLISKTTS